ncbi:PAS domain-containing protein, partial [Cribrihabitans sp. XS_ASV171]
MVVVGGALIVLAQVSGLPPIFRQALSAAGVAMAGVALVFGLRSWQARRAVGMLAEFIEKDATPSFVTDDEGAIRTRNQAAELRFSAEPGETLAAALRSVFANPSAVLYRLQSRARREGNAREDVVTRRGHVRLAVHPVGDGLLWRVEDIQDRPANGKADNLPLPMLTTGRGGAVLFMNEAARAFVGNRSKSLDRLFTELPPRFGGVNMISTSDGLRPAVVVELNGNSARQEMLLVPVEEGRETHTRPDIAALPVPIMRLSPDGSIRDVNRLASDLLGGVSKDVQLGQVMEGLGRPIPDWLRQTMTGAGGPRSEFLRLTRKDREVFVQVTLNKVMLEGQEELLAVMADATELKTLEAQFVQSQKMQAVGQLAGGVAHDFNNLLTAISGHCDLLLLRHDQGDPDYGDLVQINQNANRAAALVGQLLAFSRKQTLRPEILDLRDTLADLTHLLNRLVGE